MRHAHSRQDYAAREDETPEIHATMLREIGSLAAGEREVDPNFSVHFHRLSLPQIRLGLPFFFRLYPGFHQKGGSTNHREGGHVPFFADLCVQHPPPPQTLFSPLLWVF